MTIKDVISKAGSFAVKGISMITEANLSTCLKVGVLVGSAAVSIWLSLKKFRDKRRAYKHANEPTNAFEEGLDLNFKDLRKQKELDPKTMKKVKKALQKDLGLGREKNRSKNSSKSYRNTNFENIDCSSFGKGTNYERAQKESSTILNDLGRFINSYAVRACAEKNRVARPWGERQDIYKMWTS